MMARPRRGRDEMARLRQQYLEKQLSAMGARVRMLKGERLSFDEESKALYDAVAPTYPESHFQADSRSPRKAVPRQPGRSSIATTPGGARSSFRATSSIRSSRPPSSACRERTRAHVTLPADEQFTVEYVTNKSWSGYNWYQGDFRSLIQVNTDLPIYIDRAIDLACHEGYPGHHVYNALLEKHLVKDRGWIEFTVYPLFSPQSLIAEGTANFGIEVAFPGQERVAFERTTLFPAGGPRSARARRSTTRCRRWWTSSSYAGNEAARRYLERRDRRGRRAGVARAIRADAARSRRAARALLRSVPQLRDQLQLGKDMVRRFIESRGGTADHPDAAMAGVREAAVVAAPALRPAVTGSAAATSLLLAALACLAGYVYAYASGRAGTPIRSDAFSLLRLPAVVAPHHDPSLAGGRRRLLRRRVSRLDRDRPLAASRGAGSTRIRSAKRS